MADDNWDWDLYAVVRGYTSAAAAATTTAAADPPPPEATNTTSSHDTTSKFKEENDQFSFPNLLLQPSSTTTTQSHSFQELQQLFIPFTNNTDHHRQSQMNLQSPQSQSTSSSMNLLNSQVQIQTPRSRKRKIQQKKMVCHVTAENLSTDLWAWRKYGQKPIKGSPYPRNYYRCSSNKGCVARKQVERSVTEPEMFVVTYTGDHSHPPPTHRNSLAGSTRSKPSTTATNSLTRRENEEAPDEIVSAGESSYPSPEPDSLTWSDDEDDILIPNLAAMTEDIFLGGSSPTSKEKI